MTDTTLLKNGRIIDPAAGRDEIGDVLIAAGLIQAVGPGLEAPPGAALVDCSGQVVCPGLIDIHVHLRVPGQEYKEDIASGALAAKNGGFTAIACQPNTRPPIDTAGTVRYILEQAEGAAARVHVIGAVSMGFEHKALTEMSDLKAAGVVGIGDDAYPVQDSGFLRRAMEYCRMVDLPYIAHCEDKSLTGEGVMNEGYISTVLGLKGIPRTAEDVGTVRNILVAMAAGCRLHILHVSTRGSVAIIRHYKALGAPITCETCPQYVALTDEACGGYETNAKMSPPLRTKDDQDAIREGLADGTIDAIATDHAPHAPFEKEQEFDRAPFGMIGLETALGLVITYLVKPGVITLSDAVRKLSLVPAEILALPAGKLAVGAAADITVFDPSAEWTVDPAAFRSKSRNTALSGMVLTGKPIRTFVAGNP